MAVQQVQNLPPQFIQDIGKDLATQITAQTAIPIVTSGIAGIQQQPGETADQFKARQDAATQFGIRQQSLAGLAPQIAAQDALTTQAQQRAVAGLGSFEPALQRAQTQAQIAAGLGTQALGQLGTAGTELTQAGTTNCTSRCWIFSTILSSSTTSSNRRRNNIKWSTTWSTDHATSNRFHVTVSSTSY